MELPLFVLTKVEHKTYIFKLQKGATHYTYRIKYWLNPTTEKWQNVRPNEIASPVFNSLRRRTTLAVLKKVYNNNKHLNHLTQADVFAILL